MKLFLRRQNFNQCCDCTKRGSLDANLSKGKAKGAGTVLTYTGLSVRLDHNAGANLSYCRSELVPDGTDNIRTVVSIKRRSSRRELILPH